MRRATTSVLVGGLGLVAVAGGVWRIASLHAETIRRGSTEPRGVGILGGDGALPALMGGAHLSSWSLRNPLVLRVRLPAGTGGMALAAQTYVPTPRGIRARLILPNGGTTPIGIQRLGDRTDEAVVQIPREYPPTLSYLDVAVDVPGTPSSRFRIRPLPTTREAFDASRPVLSQPVGAGRILGRAWWEQATRADAFPAVVAAYSVQGFPIRSDEACEIQISEETPFLGPDGKPNGLAGVGCLLDASHHAGGMWTSTPYAAYVRSVRLRGEIVRRRVFDEPLDFGTFPLRPRSLPGMAVDRGWGDVEPKLDAPLAAVTPSGLRLTLLPRTTSDNTGFDMGRQTLSVRLAVDEATRTRGLPKTLAKGGAVTVGVQPVDDPGWVFREVQAPPIVLGDYQPKANRRAHLRLRVRRSVEIERLPFALVLPVAREAQGLYPANGSEMSCGSFEVDPRTLTPVLRRRASSSRGGPRRG